jgi:hypothetical protein
MSGAPSAASRRLLTLLASLLLLTAPTAAEEYDPYDGYDQVLNDTAYEDGYGLEADAPHAVYRGVPFGGGFGDDDDEPRVWSSRVEEGQEPGAVRTRSGRCLDVRCAGRVASGWTLAVRSTFPSSGPLPHTTHAQHGPAWAGIGSQELIGSQQLTGRCLVSLHAGPARTRRAAERRCVAGRPTRPPCAPPCTALAAPHAPHASPQAEGTTCCRPTHRARRWGARRRASRPRGRRRRRLVPWRHVPQPAAAGPRGRRALRPAM